MFIKNLILIIFLMFAMSQIEAAETRVKIAILDTGVSRIQARSKALCENGRINYTKGIGVDGHGHGSNIFGIIERKIDVSKQCIISYQVWRTNIDDEESVKNTIKAYKDAIKLGVKFINVSMGGGGHYSREFGLIKRAVNLGIYVIVAAGNGYKGVGVNLDKDCYYYPACYKKQIKNSKFRVVTTYTLKSSNRGSIVTDTAYGRNIKAGGKTFSGTSQATAIITSKIISRKHK